MRKLLILLSLTPIAIVTGCPKDSPSPTPNPPGPTPDPTEEVLTFGTQQMSVPVKTDVKNLNFVERLSISSSHGNSITTSFDMGSKNFDFTWKSTQSIYLTATSSSGKSLSRWVYIDTTDIGYTDAQIYASLQRSAARINLQKSSSWGAGSGYFIDYNPYNGALYYATNDHVIDDYHSNEYFVIEPNKDGSDTNVLPKLCGKIVTRDPNARNGSIDIAILQVIGVATSPTCSTYNSKVDYSGDTDKFDVLRISNISFAAYRDGTNSDITKHYTIAWPGSSGTYTENSGNIAEYVENHNTGNYIFNLIKISPYMGSGSSGAVYVDKNLNVIGINSQGFTQTQTQGIVHVSSIMKFINDHYTIKNDPNYRGQFK